MSCWIILPTCCLFASVCFLYLRVILYNYTTNTPAKICTLLVMSHKPMSPMFTVCLYTMWYWIKGTSYNLITPSYLDRLLIHWGVVTHICVCKLTIIGSNNGLSPGRRQAIIWTNAGILLIWPLETNFSEIFIEIHTFSFKTMHFKMSSGKWRPFCFDLNVLTTQWPLAAWGTRRHAYLMPRNAQDQLNIQFEIDVKLYSCNYGNKNQCMKPRLVHPYSSTNL